MKPSSFKFYGGIQHMRLCVFCFFYSLWALYIQGSRGPKKYIWIYSISPFAMTTCVTLCFLLNVFHAISRLWGFLGITKRLFAQPITICDDQECNALVFILNAFQAIGQPLCFARIKKTVASSGIIQNRWLLFFSIKNVRPHTNTILIQAKRTFRIAAIWPSVKGFIGNISYLLKWNQLNGQVSFATTLYFSSVISLLRVSAAFVSHFDATLVRVSIVVFCSGWLVFSILFIRKRWSVDTNVHNIIFTFTIAVFQVSGCRQWRRFRVRVLVSRYGVLVNLCFYFSPTDMLF